MKDRSSISIFPAEFRHLTKYIRVIHHNTRRKAKVLWGVSPHAPIHLGYDFLLAFQKRLAELESAEYEHIILIADIQDILLYGLSAAEVKNRAFYWEAYLKNYCNLNCSVVFGSDFQYSQQYSELLFRLLSLTKVCEVKDSLPSVAELRYTSELITPVMQIADAYFLGADVIIGDKGQEKLYRLMDDRTPADLHEKYGKLPHFVYLPSPHDLSGRPFSSSRSKDRISIHESRDSLTRKINSMYAPPPDQAESGRGNPLLELYLYSVFPWMNQPVRINGDDKPHAPVEREMAVAQQVVSSLDHLLSICEGVTNPKTIYKRLLSAGTQTDEAKFFVANVDVLRESHQNGRAEGERQDFIPGGQHVALADVLDSKRSMEVHVVNSYGELFRGYADKEFDCHQLKQALIECLWDRISNANEKLSSSLTKWVDFDRVRAAS